MQVASQDWTQHCQPSMNYTKCQYTFITMYPIIDTLEKYFQIKMSSLVEHNTFLPITIRSLVKFHLGISISLQFQRTTS